MEGIQLDNTHSSNGETEEKRARQEFQNDVHQACEQRLEALRQSAATDIQNLQADVVAKNREIARLKAELSGVLNEDTPEGAEVKALLDLWWREVMGSDKRVKHDLKSTRAPKVRKAIKRRGIETCRKAVLGVVHDDWAMGRVAKTAGRSFNDIAEHILATDGDIERFVKLYEQAGKPALVRFPDPVVESVTLDEFLGLLENARPAGDGWDASCPAHEDAKPSLHVSQGDKGIVAHCFGGCTAQEIADAINVPLTRWFAAETRPLSVVKPELAPLCMDREVQEWTARLQQHGRLLDRLAELRGWAPETLRVLGVGYDGQRLTLPVHDGSGQLQNVLRYLPVRKNGEKKLLALKGRPRDLFPAPETLDGDEVWLFEGEPDSITGHQLGLRATALPGVNGWRVEWASRFGARRVIVCLDCDEQGRKAAQRVVPSLTQHALEVRVVDLAPDRSDGFDVSDFVREGGDAGALLKLALAAGAVVRIGEAA